MQLQLVKIAKVLGTDDLFAYLDKVGGLTKVWRIGWSAFVQSKSFHQA